MTKLKKPLIIAAAIIAVCGAVVAAAAFNIDKILMRISPELYLGYIAVNTMNELDSELAMIDEAMPDIPKLSESHSLGFTLDTEDTQLSLTEDYNKDAPSVVFTGICNDINFDGYINNTETALCLPSLLDVYFTFSTQDFGNEFVDGGGNNLLPIGVPRGLDLTLPSGNDSGEILSRGQLINFARTISEDAEIRHDSGDDYFLILRGENVKTALRDLVTAMLSSDILKQRLERIDNILNIGLDSYGEYLLSLIDSMEPGETLAVKYTQTKNYVSRIEAELPFPDSTLTLLADSRGARLLDDYTISVISESGGSQVGIEYSRNGNRMFADEEKTDAVECRVIFGGEELLRLGYETVFDKNNTGFSGSFELLTNFLGTSEISGDLSGAPAVDRDWASGMYMDITNIVDSGGSPGTCSVQLMQPMNLQTAERDKYPFSELNLDDISSLLELMQR